MERKEASCCFSRVRNARFHCERGDLFVPVKASVTKISVATNAILASSSSAQYISGNCENKRVVALNYCLLNQGGKLRARVYLTALLYRANHANYELEYLRLLVLVKLPTPKPRDKEGTISASIPPSGSFYRITRRALADGSKQTDKRIVDSLT
ncbi:hypothetical protein ALC53_11402 [Atta colombica]|uniref:Uncharacterized protein n=1 Tax=Atta colombica TaxID=520822 RepID=A0A195B1Q1_9HYME|nr:hypothetical protein ALC53_11402 [Atta colombica]